MRKVYQTVTVVPAENAHLIHLDDKPANTPQRVKLRLATLALAEAVAEEWRAQEVFVVPATMPLTQIAATAIDRVAPRMAEAIDTLLEYAATDLLCYRAPEPEELAQEQSALFDPFLEWFEERTGVALVVARGIMPVEQHAAALEALRPHLEAKSAEALTAMQLAASLASSLVIALALAEQRIDGETAFATANVEELYQLRKWGEDDEARERLNAVRQEFLALGRFIALI